MVFSSQGTNGRARITPPKSRNTLYARTEFVKMSVNDLTPIPNRYPRDTKVFFVK